MSVFTFKKRTKKPVEESDDDSSSDDDEGFEAAMVDVQNDEMDDKKGKKKKSAPAPAPASSRASGNVPRGLQRGGGAARPVADTAPVARRSRAQSDDVARAGQQVANRRGGHRRCDGEEGCGRGGGGRGRQRELQLGLQSVRKRSVVFERSIELGLQLALAHRADVACIVRGCSRSRRGRRSGRRRAGPLRLLGHRVVPVRPAGIALSCRHLGLLPALRQRRARADVAAAAQPV